MAENMNKIIVAFIIVILGTVFLSTIADNIFFLTNSHGVTNETLEINDTRLTLNQINDSIPHTLNEDDWIDITSISVFNGTLLTEDVHWNHTSLAIYFINGTAMQSGIDIGVENTTYVIYTFYPDDYIRGSAVSRTLINLIPLFFVIALFIIFVMHILKDSAIMDGNIFGKGGDGFR